MGVILLVGSFTLIIAAVSMNLPEESRKSTATTGNCPPATIAFAPGEHPMDMEVEGARLHVLMRENGRYTLQTYDRCSGALLSGAPSETQP